MSKKENILVTGGAGFIGSNFVLDWLAASDEPVLNLDTLTYAGNLENLASLQGDACHVFVQGDLGDRTLVDCLLAEHWPRAVLSFAAESHVGRSIHGSEDERSLLLGDPTVGIQWPIVEAPKLCCHAICKLLAEADIFD